MESSDKHIPELSDAITKINITQPVLWFYLFILIIILAIGEFSYQSLKRHVAKQKAIEISSIAELKVQQITEFRERRLQNAQLFHGNQTFIEDVKKYIRGRDFKSVMGITDWLNPIYENHFYNDIIIIDPKTRKNIFAFRKSHLELTARVDSNDLKCLESDSIRFGELTFDKDDDSVRLSILVPLILRKESSSEKIAVLKFLIDPHQRLYDIMQSMPNSGRSGEVLIVKRDGNDVLYLNELRFKKNAALKLRIPITTKELPAAKALLGDENVSEGIDYRGVKVLAIARLIPGTDWSLVVKFDIDEIYSDLKTLGILILGMVLILLIALGFGLNTIWARKRLNYYKLRVNDLMTIQKLNHVYKLLTEVEQAIVKNNARDSLLNEICTIIANEGSYSLVWIGILNSQTGCLELIQRCKSENKYYLTLQAGITQKFVDSQYPSTKAVNEGKSFISNNLQNDLSIEELRVKAIPGEFHSMAVIPLQQCSETIGAFYFYAYETGYFTNEEIKLLERLSADLSYALDKIKQEEILYQSEHELRIRAKEIEAILSCIADGVVVYDNNGRIVLSNSTADQILKFPRYERELTIEERLSGGNQTWSEDEDNRKLNIQEIPAFQSYMYGKTIRNHIFLIRSDGDGHWVNVSSAPLIVSGKTTGAVVSLSDISKLKMNEKALMESENRLRELNATKDKLFSILSHDLKGPFTSIVGFSELLIEDIRKKNFDEIENFAKVIIDSSENAMNLLTNLIEWSRLQTGRIKFNPEEFDINIIISEVLDLLLASASQKSIIINSDIPPRLNVFADKFMIGTVLRNIISNAIKFSYQDGIILISGLKNNSAVIIKVSDNGVGMNQKVLKKLFKFEENFSTPGTQNEKGTGLGMIICKEFITKHNGKLWVESEIGKGSSFFFTLPSLRF